MSLMMSVRLLELEKMPAPPGPCQWSCLQWREQLPMTLMSASGIRKTRAFAVPRQPMEWNGCEPDYALSGRYGMIAS